MSDSKVQFAALDRSIAETTNQVRLSSKVNARMRELLRKNGLVYGYSEQEALEQATLEVTGVRAKQAKDGTVAASHDNDPPGRKPAGAASRAFRRETGLA